ncbi:ABC transporter ATP-binding protein [Caulobacter sp. FWC2]|uniref:ABC transporter ATP-binding protein n=1 Tax=Caulobacter sp. FWC2 TaxID=69664 RepID=UPI000C147450|nr:ABC transporter ATP-binding protein [Caulobacter sp. FWC2]PIB92141.1 hypothetical protein CSW62_11510 [Caulobacter sp. FWC2]
MAVGLVAAGALVEGLGLTLLIPILGLVSDQAGSSWPARATQKMFAALGVNDTGVRLTLLLAGFLALMMLRGLVVGARDLAQMSLQAGFVERQRRDVMRALTSAPWASVERLRHGRVTQAMGGEVMRVAAAANFLLTASVAAVAIAVQLTLALVLSPLLTLVAIGLGLLGLATLMPWLRRGFAGGAALTQLGGGMADIVNQYLGGMKLAVSQNLQDGYQTRFERALGKIFEHHMALSREQVARRTRAAIATALIGALLLFVGLRVIQAPPLVLLAVLALLIRASGPAAQVQQSAQIFVQALPSYLQLRALCTDLAPPPAPTSRPPAVAIPRRPAIVLHDIGLTRDETWVLRGLDLALEPGEVVGLAGPSGAGKSTLADVLVGLLPPGEGEIRLAGCVLDEGQIPAWRDLVGYVSQDPFLFHDTVRANLAWGARDCDQAAIWGALEQTGAAPMVRAWPMGLETQVGERGTLMSGGERQRLALARAILRRPDLLILDEATNAIDLDSEKRVLENLRALSPRPTILLIAHRPESFAACDRVVRLESGRLRPVDRAALASA